MIAIDESALDELAAQCQSFGKCGCYVFSRKSGRGSTPIYVGKAEKQTIKNEAFNSRNIKSVHAWLNDQAKRKLQIWTIAQPGRGRPHKTAIDEIETVVIHWARLENPDILNIQKTKGLNWWIKGVERAGQGRRPKAATDFRKMIGLD